MLFPPSPSPLLLFLSLHKLFPTEERKLRKALWFHLERRGFFTEESMATTTRKKSTREEEHILSANTTGLVPFLLLGGRGLRLQLLQSSLPPVPAYRPSQPCNDMRKPNLLLFDRPVTCVTSHQRRTLRRCQLPFAGTAVKQ